MTLLVQPTNSLPPDLDDLVAASRREDLDAVARLQDDWQSGASRFDRPGEVLLIARRSAELAGVCGLSVDLWGEQASVGRIRSLYVHPGLRRQGVATELLRMAVAHAAAIFGVINVKTGRDDAAAFLLARGFVTVAGDDSCTHQLHLDTSESFQTFEPDFTSPTIDRGQITVREAGSRDVEGVAALAERAGDGDYERLTEQIGAWRERADRYLVVAISDHRVVGYGRAAWFEPDRDAPEGTAPTGWYLSGLRVDQDWRGRGISRELTRDRLDWIAQRSTEAWYFANEGNHVSRRLHASLGFEEVTREFSFPGVSFAGGAGILARVSLQPR